MHRARLHAEHFNRAVIGGDWEAFAHRFAENARMAFVNVPAGPFQGRAAILDGYRQQPPSDTMTVDSVVTVDPATDRVHFRWDHGGAGTMLLRWRRDEIAALEVTFD